MWKTSPEMMNSFRNTVWARRIFWLCNKKALRVPKRNSDIGRDFYPPFDGWLTERSGDEENFADFKSAFSNQCRYDRCRRGGARLRGSSR